MKIKLSKSQWEKAGRRAGWFADGGAAYTEDEMDLMALQKIKANNNRPEKIKQIMDLYVSMHPKASGYELNTLWADIGQMSMKDINQYVDKYVSKWTRQSTTV
jgi:hypothetical protein